MEKVLLRLKKPWKIYKAGDVVSVPAGLLPKRMIENGTAERYIKKRIKKDGNDDKDSGDSRTD
jgi:quercetin dioxygenase-like cupin family protein